MKPPRSPRTLRLLDSLEKIYVSDTASPSERLAAAALTAKILARSNRKKTKKDKPPVMPAYSGKDSAPARPEFTPAKPAAADTLRYFDDLERK